MKDFTLGRIVLVVVAISTIVLSAIAAHSNAVSSIKKDIRDYLVVAIQSIQQNQAEDREAIKVLQKDVREIRDYVILLPRRPAANKN